ncbi:alpha/beta hydrolase [Kribbella antibiotica]|uniref:Alpha/beta hydrolase n=1 Tax=Kribbella antibiotica TaxID=190195 RepID=A0A4R4YMM2_9ACTN|nr:alpha/beta hydrolase [Kribbella antibiotica]TDD46236.1 alpha/beta hydrolase [Kribbella antibiotica]
MPSKRSVRLNGIDIHLAEQGEGPLVVLVHGFPETSHSWRHQLEALAGAGYHAVALDQRGYGDSDRPEAIDQYSIFHLVGDVVALIHELGEEQAVVVGHDWGSIVAWQTALLRPAVVRGVVGISVPPWPRGPVPPLTATAERFGPDFYQNYFQEPGVADAELGNDIEGSLRRIYAGVSTSNPTPGFAGQFADPEELPAWLPEEDLAVFVRQFTTSSFTGGLNYYRNLDHNWEQLAAWQDAPITPPSLYISGEKDMVRMLYPMDEAARAIVPDLRGVVDVPDCGHWTQQEKPEVVNAALIEFLKEL